MSVTSVCEREEGDQVQRVVPRVAGEQMRRVEGGGLMLACGVISSSDALTLLRSDASLCRTTFNLLIK